jgi:2-hydroxychromene-2-carboxylate isomerase
VILQGLGQNPHTIIEQANAQVIRDKYDAETETARSLGIFGSPTFVVGAVIFWGDDRLEDALVWSQKK